MILRALSVLALVPLAAVPQDQDVEELILRLGAEDVRDRDRSARALIELGERARPAVEKACGSKDPEISHRARQVIKGFGPRARMGELFDAGFDRTFEDSVPGFAGKLWSEDPKEILGDLEIVMGVGLNRYF